MEGFPGPAIYASADEPTLRGPEWVHQAVGAGTEGTARGRRRIAGGAPGAGRGPEAPELVRDGEASAPLGLTPSVRRFSPPSPPGSPPPPPGPPAAMPHPRWPGGSPFAARAPGTPHRRLTVGAGAPGA